MENDNGKCNYTGSSKAIEFNYYLPVNIVFGSGKVNKAGELAKLMAKRLLL